MSASPPGVYLPANWTGLRGLSIGFRWFQILPESSSCWVLETAPPHLVLQCKESSTISAHSHFPDHPCCTLTTTDHISQAPFLAGVQFQTMADHWRVVGITEFFSSFFCLSCVFFAVFKCCFFKVASAWSLICCLVFLPPLISKILKKLMYGHFSFLTSYSARWSSH